MDPHALPTPSDEIIREAAEPQLGQAIDASRWADAIRSVEKAKGWSDSDNALDTDIAAELGPRRQG